MRYLLVALCLAFAFPASAEDWSTFWPRFQAAVWKGNRKAVADMTTFPFTSYDIFSKLPKKFAEPFRGGPVELKREDFVKYFPRIFDAEARRRMKTSRPAMVEDGTCANVKVWQGKGWYAWLVFCQDDGVWTLRRTDNVSG